MFERRVQVQGRDGRAHEFVLPETALPQPTPASSAPAMLRLALPPLATSESRSPAASFFRQSRDASNSVLSFLDPDSWLNFESASSACRAAILASGSWSGPVLRRSQGGHLLRFRPEERKGAYVRHRRSMWRVSKAFQDLRRFARSPSSVFNPGATMADTFRAEERTGVVFPEEARASFSIFDGQARSAWLRSEGVIGGFELLSLEESVELMLEDSWFRGLCGALPEFVPLASRRNSNEWLAAMINGGRVCVIKPFSRPKVVASSWSNYLRVQ